MKKEILFLFAGIALSSIVSCKKSSGGGTAAPAQLIGAWKFISLKAHTQSAVQETASGTTFKSITTSDYTTINNAGTVVFSADMLTSTGLTYEVNTTLYVTEYQDGQFLNALTSPFDFIVPVTNSSAKYQAIGTDSLYFPAGGLASSPSISGGTPQASPASGSKYTIHGDTLSVVSVVHQTATQSAPGDVVTSTDDGTETVTLKKQ